MLNQDDFSAVGDRSRAIADWGGQRIIFFTEPRITGNSPRVHDWRLTPSAHESFVRGVPGRGDVRVVCMCPWRCCGGGCSRVHALISALFQPCYCRGTGSRPRGRPVLPIVFPGRASHLIRSLFTRRGSGRSLAGERQRRSDR